MKISKRDLNTLLILFGLAVFIMNYFLLYSGFIDDTALVNEEIAALKPRQAVLNNHVVNIPGYNAGMESSALIAADNLKWFPKQIRTEDLIMYAVGIERDLGVEINSAQFSEPWEITSFDAKTEVGQETVSHYSAYGVTLTFSFHMDYEAMKKVLNRITSDPERTALDNISVSYDTSTGALTGTLALSKVYADDGSYVYVATDVPPGAVGIKNPFGAVSTQ
ncbi:MAG: hypothetical protein LBM98_08920 [Oscillospiraceae bacterium]|jgi:Tfp pilus assembly protein PilO|nr:hypothetical protein [Oscillospiraceae bacterium]